MTYVPNPAQLRRCPECGGGWPNDPDHALRGCAWLHGLPRKVSPSNNELLIHDGAHGRDRFLQFEVKSLKETWPPARGQFIKLVALAGLTNWTVRILRGRTDAVDVHRVTPKGIETSGVRTHVEAVRQAVSRWLDGQPWSDALPAGKPGENVSHTHGWARVNGVWTCIQDHYAIGFRPDTGCGATIEQTA